MNRKQILDDAAAAVLTDRAATHGAPENSFGDIAQLWSAFIDKELQPWQVAIMLGLLKVARAKSNPTNPDNWADMAGYAACGGELAQPDGKTITLGQIKASSIKASEARNPNLVEVVYVDPHTGDQGNVLCEDVEDITKNGAIPYTLVLKGFATRDQARIQGLEFIKSKSVLVNR